MKTLHIVYTIPYPQRFLYRVINKLNNISWAKNPAYRDHQEVIDWPHPNHAPHSITQALIRTFKGNVVIKMYDWLESPSNSLSVRNDDLLLVHPLPEFENWEDFMTWKGVNKNTVGYQLMQKLAPANVYVIMPYTHDAHRIPWLSELFETYKNVIFICGKNWTNDWSKSPYGNHQLNLLQLDMCIDQQNYPLVKQHFNPVGQRKYLYIGSTIPFKNTGQLEKIAKAIPGFQGGYISKGQLAGWNQIASFADLTPAFMTDLLKEYDIFINCSIADAQATTILEQMSLGTTIACTTESGIDYPSVFKLHPSDTAFNVSQLEKIQQMSETDLLNRGRENHEIIKRFHSWNKFSSEIAKFVAI